MHQNIEMLRAIGENAAENRALDPEQLQWLGEVVGRFLAREAGSLDEAVGLRLGRGGMPWWVEEANRLRDEALRALAAAVCSDEGPTARARKIRQLTSRYAASAWCYDRHRDEMPYCYEGTAKQYLWAAFKSGGHLPLCERQLRNILT